MEARLPKRKHPRLKGYDYSTFGGYFVTICVQNRRCLLSRVSKQQGDTVGTELTVYGEIAQKQLRLLEERYSCLRIDQYVIMPNHIHVIMVLGDTAGASPRPTATDAAGASPRPTATDAAGASPRPTIPEIVCAYKSLTTRACKKVKPIDKLFQTSFYEHVIRGQEDYDEIAQYIRNNPKQWELDSLYSEK